MKTIDFGYELPPELIAQAPAEPRDSSRLMVYTRDTDTVEHRVFHELPELLQRGDTLVLNDTRVIPARLATTAGHEVFLLRERGEQLWECLVRGGKHFAVGAEFAIAPDFTGLVQEVTLSGTRLIQFTAPDFAAALEQHGASPLPPYIEQTDPHVPAYQTVFARMPGSVAAPTAGLHFTERVFAALAERGVAVEYVTLHVGLGTFLPVKAEEITDHTMHSEVYELSQSTAERLNVAKSAGRRVIAVGSTACRVLESCTDRCGRLLPQSGETSIFIYPGYQWRFVDGLLTNFHLPQSTLIMLVSALIGREKTLELYELAKHEKYRFYSFGDAMLLL